MPAPGDVAARSRTGAPETMRHNSAARQHGVDATSIVPLTGGRQMTTGGTPRAGAYARLRARALGTSGIAGAVVLAAGWSGAAHAQCAPEPTVANGTTTCAGTDANGLTVTTTGTRVLVPQGAVVQGAAGAPAVAVRIASPSQYEVRAGVEVAGRVDGGTTGAGVLLAAQQGTNGYPYSHVLDLTVAAGGTVTGTTGVLLQSGSFSTSARATINNSGTIAGTAANGLALSASGGSAGFTSITNRAGGTIGAISGSVGAFGNAGTVNGASRSAVDTLGGGFGSFANTGTITSAGATATVAGFASFSQTATNSGTIANTGAGTALEGTAIALNNAAGGRVSAAGGTAIRSSGAITLTNAGTIDGSVTSTATGQNFANSFVDSTAGRINGSLTLGVGSDVLVAVWRDGRADTGVTGAVNGGGGTDLLRLRFDAAATLTAPVALPANFEQLALTPASGVTATLGAGFANTGTLFLGGQGTVVNRAALSATGQVVAQLSTYYASVSETSTPAFTNEGSITAAVATGAPFGSANVYAVTLDSGARRFDNGGTVSSGGGGVSVSGSGVLNNTGSITAAATALQSRGWTATNAAGATIRSTGGVGLALTGSTYEPGLSNAGRIEGVAAGASVFGVRLTNTGVVQGTQAGVQFQSYGSLDNRAGGVVTGGTAGVTAAYQSGGFAFNNSISNAGTINGNVVLGDARDTLYGNDNSYFALAGGVLNGNLSLGRGDTLVAELAGTGGGRYAGISGTVSATASVLRLRVRAATTAAASGTPGFATVGYDLFDDAALTLTGAAAPVQIAGRGSVDLTANLSSGTSALISTASVLTAPGEAAVQNALSVTSRGTLSLTLADTNSFTAGAVAVSNTDAFTNAGTIVATDRRPTGYAPVAAIFGGYSFSAGGPQVTNSGTVTLDGAVGVSGAARVVNSGTIAQAAGAQRAATGVTTGSYALTLVNSGTISVGGLAVQGSSGGTVIENSGRLASTGTAAIRITSFGGASVTNAATGTIAGTGGTAIQMTGGTLANAGIVTGSVNLGYATFGQSFGSGTYVADGGTLAGDLLFGSGSDTLVSFGELGVSGRVDGGGGIDTYVQARRTSGDVTLALPAAVANFERVGARAVGADTVLTLRADAPVAGVVAVSGDGRIVNAAEVAGRVSVLPVSSAPFGVPAEVLGGFTNRAAIRGGFDGAVRAFANEAAGTVGTDALAGQAVRILSDEAVSFDNAGRILNNGVAAATLIASEGGVAAVNSGTIAGGFSAESYARQAAEGEAPGPSAVSLANSGTITGAVAGARLDPFYGQNGVAVQLLASAAPGGTASATLANTGLIEVARPGVVAAYLNVSGADGTGASRTVAVTNSGTIRADAGGIVQTYPYYGYRFTQPANALLVSSDADGAAATVATVTNTGTIEATGERSAALGTYDIGLDLANSGTIRGTAGTVLASDDGLAEDTGGFLAGAIQVVGEAADRVVNTGAIIGSVALGLGDDLFENRGRMEGDVFLGAGNDRFLQLASATLTGIVDAGDGDDLFTVDATGGGAVNGDRFVGFERFAQVGEGTVAYSGRFRFDSIALAGGTLTVAAGQTLSTDGPTTVTGTDAAETVKNMGVVAGNLSLGAGADRVVNRGRIGGTVYLGDGDDVFVDKTGSSVAGGVDGGAGDDLYTVALTGDRTGIGARTGFERLAVRDAGTLTLALDQDFASVRLMGSGLDLALNGRRVGPVVGSEGNERFAVDGDVARVSLDAGDDRLQLGATLLAGAYDGGAGTDVLRFAATGPVTLAGTAAGFERVELAGGALTVTGTLGSGATPLAFGEGAQSLTVARGGTLAGAVDLGAGDDALRLAAGSTLTGSVAGGAGTDTAVLELAGDRTLAATTLTGFERLGAEGSGALTLAGAQTYERVDSAVNLTVASGAALTAPVRFGAGDQRLTVAGRFAGSVDGGAGNDAVTVSGGTEAAPVAFSTVTGVEAFAMTGGFATVSGTAGLGGVDLSGGRLVGLSNSVLTAAQFTVRQGATFGSAGTVNGNVAVAAGGTLSPGASPGTMTVNGNVSLAAGSVSLFELTPTVSDRLVVNGALSIAPGATLRLTTTGAIAPGTSFDLVSASGGIAGSYSTVERPASLFGALVQDANRIRLLGQFLGMAGASPQVARSVDYANALLATGRAQPAFLAAVPALLAAGGGTDAAAFARLTPEPYATATQAGVDDALALVATARGPAFAAPDRPGPFTFGQGLANWQRLGADRGQGVSAAASRGWGLIGGLGYAGEDWSAGVFGGRLETHQAVGALAARTSADGFVAGAHARWAPDSLGGALKVTASVLYDGADASTRRALPGGATASGGYGLKSWVSDLSASYALDTGTDWALSPRVGVTWLRTTRGAVAEAGGPFALTVARDRHRAGFADLGIGVARSEASDAAFRPYATLGVRYQLEGRRADAVAAYAGGPLGLVALGAQRARAVATAAAGLSARVTEALELFSTASVQAGRDDSREAVSTGLRLRF